MMPKWEDFTKNWWVGVWRGADGAVSVMTADNKQFREDLCN